MHIAAILGLTATIGGFASFKTPASIGLQDIYS